MVQVDVFWGYGWGASLAVAAGRQLAKAQKPYETKYHVNTILFLALSWAPTGLLLLIRHPSWETMQVARDFAHIPAWLTLAFGITNITQGLLGFWVGRALMAKGRYWDAQLNWIAGYFGMFFILLYGWDGLGYDRFLYDRDLLPGSPAWTAGAGTATGVAAALIRFLTSGVAMTLYIDGLWLLPPFAALFSMWHGESARLAGVEAPRPVRLMASYLFGVFGVGFAAAAACALATRGIAYALGVGDHVARGLGEIPPATARHVLAYFIGLPIGLAIVHFLWLRPGMPGRRLLQPLWLTQDRKH
jgi:hypothetical protein